MRCLFRDCGSYLRSVLVIGMIGVGFLLAVPGQTHAAAANGSATQGAGSVGLQGTISENAPTTAATIVAPVNGASFTALPITVSGLCPKGLLIKIFSNNVFVGSTECNNGSYALQISLFGGQNDLIARDYDALDQVGPDSNTVDVNFTDAQLAQFGNSVLITSSFAKRGADPETTLTWPIIISGGTGPYAVSVDWGDNSPNSLLSEPFAGTVTLTHVYSKAGVYSVIIKATDTNGTEAFLQVVAVADGAIQSNTTNSSNSTTVVQTKVLWWPAVAMVPLIIATFWVGRRHELFTLRRQLENNRKNSK
jgi:hypothetical protein